MKCWDELIGGLLGQSISVNLIGQRDAYKLTNYNCSSDMLQKMSSISISLRILSYVIDMGTQYMPTSLYIQQKRNQITTQYFFYRGPNMVFHLKCYNLPFFGWWDGNVDKYSLF